MMTNFASKRRGHIKCELMIESEVQFADYEQGSAHIRKEEAK